MTRPVSALEAKPLEFTCDLAIVSIKKNRRQLARLIQSGGSVNITLTGAITSVWGSDDGIDQEFQMDVKSIRVGKVTT